MTRERLQTWLFLGVAFGFALLFCVLCASADAVPIELAPTVDGRITSGASVRVDNFDCAPSFAGEGQGGRAITTRYSKSGTTTAIARGSTRGEFSQEWGGITSGNPNVTDVIYVVEWERKCASDAPDSVGLYQDHADADLMGVSYSMGATMFSGSPYGAFMLKNAFSLGGAATYENTPIQQNGYTSRMRVVYWGSRESSADATWDCQRFATGNWMGAGLASRASTTTSFTVTSSTIPTPHAHVTKHAASAASVEPYVKFWDWCNSPSNTTYEDGLTVVTVFEDAFSSSVVHSNTHEGMAEYFDLNSVEATVPAAPGFWDFVDWDTEDALDKVSGSGNSRVDGWFGDIEAFGADVPGLFWPLTWLETLRP